VSKWLRRALTGALLACWSILAAVAAAVPDSTRVIRIVANPQGGYAWRMMEVPVPEPGDHEVLVHVRAVSIQRADLDVLKGMPEQMGGPGLEGQIAGSDAAGDIVRVGRAVKSLRAGQRVISFFCPDYVDHPLSAAASLRTLGMQMDGTFGDYIVLRDTAVVPMPQHLSYAEAAAVPSAAVVAWGALGVERNVLHRGDTVLVEGTGGIATFAVQFAVALGARVIVTSSSDDKLERMRALGAWAGINYRKVAQWGEETLRLTGGHGADLVIDMGGRSTLAQSMKALAYEGNLAAVGGLGGGYGAIDEVALILKGATARGVFATTRNDAIRMVRFMEHHRIHPVVERTYPFAQFEQAYSNLEAGNFVGKLVLVL
jgi:NADPH:quinone reductase-like Zn-dependent oxidoreductase